MRLGQNSLVNNSLNKTRDTKAGALLCPTCCVEYVEVQFDFEVNGILLHNVKALRCPNCNEEIFTPEQWEIIGKQVDI